MNIREKLSNGVVRTTTDRTALDAPVARPGRHVVASRFAAMPRSADAPHAAAASRARAGSHSFKHSSPGQAAIFLRDEGRRLIEPWRRAIRTFRWRREHGERLGPGSLLITVSDEDERRRVVPATIRSEHRASRARRQNLDLVIDAFKRHSIDVRESGGQLWLHPGDRERAQRALPDTPFPTMITGAGTTSPSLAATASLDSMVDPFAVFQYRVDPDGRSILDERVAAVVNFGEPDDRDAPPTPRVDAVYTWVDGGDLQWRRRAHEHMRAAGEQHPEAAGEARFISRDELRFSLRSLERYAEFVDHVYLVTDDQRPDWLSDNPRLTVVDHREIFPDTSMLPTFNSHAIESCLHRIPGLADHFIYLNDDFFFAGPNAPSVYFDDDGRVRCFESHAGLPDENVTDAMRPVDAAGLNVRELVRATWTVDPRQKFKHAPYALRRDVYAEIETLFPDVIEQTRASRFRSATDVAVASALHQHVALELGVGVLGDIDAGYVDLGASSLRARLERLRQDRTLDVFCLNDSDTRRNRRRRQERLAVETLEMLFPEPSEFEL